MPSRSRTPAKKGKATPSKAAPPASSPEKADPAAAETPKHCCVTGAACGPNDEKTRPTVAVSDAFNAIGHAIAALWAFKAGDRMMALGFASVALAASFGVLRFGVCPPGFRNLNNVFATLAGFVGMPLVGYSTWKSLGGLSAVCNTLNCCTSKQGDEVDYIVLTLVVYGMVSATVVTECGLDLARTVVNALGFVIPTAIRAYQTKDARLGATLAAVMAVAVVIGADNDRLFMGFRRVNFFHYAIGAAAMVVAASV